MIVKNVKVYREDQTFADGEIRILDGVFEKVCTGAGRGEGILAEKDETVIDGDGAYICSARVPSSSITGA